MAAGSSRSSGYRGAHRCPSAAIDAARAEIEAAEAKIFRYRAALDSGADVGVVAQWIGEAQTQRLAAQHRLEAAAGGKTDRLSREEIKQLVAGLGDLVGVLGDADSADKNAIYIELGLKLTYQPGANKIIARAKPGRSCNKTCPRGDLNPHALYGH